MRRQNLSLCLMTCGLLLMLISVANLPALPVAQARQPQAAPSPRPPIASTPDRPPRDRDDGDDDDDQPVLQTPGRITGTVIDQTSGAPAVGVTVNVGGDMVVTDANGNYDLGDLQPGNYGVVLLLGSSQGEPSQGLQTVRLEAGATVVLHLGFHSLQQATPLPPTAEPSPLPATAEPPLVPATAQATLPAPTAALPIGRLPNTGTVAESAGTQPSRLPQTAGYLDASWLWLILGMALVLSGVGLRPYANRWIALARETALVQALTRPHVAAPLSLGQIAGAQNLLVVGGGTRLHLLRQIIALRSGTHIVLDPGPGVASWQTRVVGANGNQGEAERYLRAALVATRQRQLALLDGAAAESLQPITLVLADLSATVTPHSPELPLIMRALLTEGRRVGRFVLAAAPNDNPRPLGMLGRGSMLAAFDYVIYLGDEAVQRLPAAATLPYPAVVYRARGNSIALLEMPALV